VTLADLAARVTELERMIGRRPVKGSVTADRLVKLRALGRPFTSRDLGITRNAAYRWIGWAVDRGMVERLAPGKYRAVK
jgi:hypothetical protein